MTDPSPATASHSIRKRRKWPWVLASLGFLLVTLLVFAPTLLSTALVRERLLSALGSQLHGDLDVEELSVSWSGPQRLEGLRLRPTGSEDSSNDLLQLDSASIDQGLLGLAFGGDQVLVELRRLRLYVHRAADGRFNFAPLLEDPPGDRNPAPSAPKEPTSSPPPTRAAAASREYSAPRTAASVAVAFDGSRDPLSRRPPRDGRDGERPDRSGRR